MNAGPLLVRSIANAVDDRLSGSGWISTRTEGRRQWTEPAPTGGRQDIRQVAVDEIPGDPGGRVVEGYNGFERLVIRCTPDTSITLLLRTLDDWQVLPAEREAPR